MRLWAALAVGMVGLGWSMAVTAHPHAWIDVSVEVLFDAAGRVSALRQGWLFDEFYTADTVQKGERSKMDLLTTRIMHNLKDWGYFTRVRQGGRDLPLAMPTQTSARMDGHRLLMTFVVPLAEAVAPGQDGLTYSVFDPTYFIEMLHAETADAIRLTGAPAQCRFRLLPAKPDPKAVAVAAAIDRTRSGGDGLGAQFAEKVEIKCDVQP